MGSTRPAYLLTMRNQGFSTLRSIHAVLAGAVLGAVLSVVPVAGEARDMHRDIEPRGLIAPRPQPPRMIDSYIGRDQDRVRDAREAGEIKSFGEIRKKIEKRFGGHIIDVDLDQDDPGSKHSMYRVRVLSDNGQVLLVSADAVTGEIVDVKGQK